MKLGRVSTSMEDVSLKKARYLQSLSGLFQGKKRETPLDSPEAFSALYELNYRPVYRYLFGLQGGPVEDVEDLAAETFIRAWKARRSFTGDPDKAVGWLLCIARRLAIDAYRRGRVRIQPEIEMPEEIPQRGPTPEDRLLADERRQTLWILLQKLPIEQREMLVLRYMLDWRVHEIGEYLHISENTISVTIHRVLARLQRDWPQGKE